MSSLSRARIILLMKLLVLLFLIQLPLASSGTCSTPPAITLTQYNSIKAGTTIAQMQQLLGGLGYLQAMEYASALYAASSNTYTYYYRGTNMVQLYGSGNMSTYSYATFAFNPTTQQLTYKTQYGLC